MPPDTAPLALRGLFPAIGIAAPLLYLLRGNGYPKGMDGRVLLADLGRLHPTRLGAERIRKNMALDEGDDPVAWCTDRILSQGTAITRKGKNWYVSAGDCVITVNAHSLTVITARRR